MSGVINMNWCPEQHTEFAHAVAEGRVQLNIQPEQYSWLYDNILPFSPLQVFFSYQKKLLRLMASSEEAFWKVHRKGIDLILFAPGSRAPQ